MKDKSNFVSKLVLVSLFIFAVFGAGFAAGNQGRLSAASPLDLFQTFAGISAEPPTGVNLDPLWRAWNVLETRFVSNGDSPTTEEKIWGMIKGLAASYDDPYTMFLDPELKKSFDESLEGTFSGVGMEIGVQDDQLMVIAPLKDTPASRAGIEPGDFLLKIDNTFTQDLSVDEAVNLIRGEKGTSVELTLLREGQSAPFTVTVVRDEIHIPILETEKVGSTFIIHLYSFSSTSPELFREAMKKFVSDTSSDSLVIDLRSNPGGYLEAAVDISSYFLPSGSVVVKENFGDARPEELHRSKGYEVSKVNPDNVVVLVNEGSASASEIVAGALKDHDVATIVGTQTFGKGSVQELVDITGDAALKVTIARWLTPDGISISEGGLEPDDVVQDDPETPTVDEQLNEALELLKKQN